MAEKGSKRHQMIEAVRNFSSMIQFSERNFDFSTEDGKELIRDARKACEFLEKEIQILYPKK